MTMIWITYKNKRAVSLFIIIAVCLCAFAFPVQAEEVTDAALTEYHCKQLTELGVLTYDVSEDMYQQPVSRIHAYGAAMGLLGDLLDGLHYDTYTFSDISDLAEADKIQFAYEQGCIEPNWKFDPQTPATVGETVRMIVSEMGYSEIAKTLGEGNSGYMTMARRLDLLSGLSISQNDILTWEMLIQLLSNSLDAKILHLIGYDSENEVLAKVTGDTMLNVYFDIYKVSGVVEANQSGALNGYNDAGEGYVMIGGKRMKTGDSAADEYLGYYVDCYARLSGSEYTIVSAEKSPTQNREWKIAAEDLLVDHSRWSPFRIIYQNESGKTKELSLPSDVSVIYNGRQLFDYTADDLKIVLGEITAVDAKGSGTPQVVLVSEYKNYIADAYSETQNILYSKNLAPLKFESDSDVFITNVNGEEYPLTDITEYTVLSLSVSKDGKCVRGMALKDKVSGQVTRISQNDGKTELTLDSGKVEKYTVSRGWNGKDCTGKPISLTVGKRYLIYLDKNGFAAAFVEKNSGLIYAFLYEASVNRTFDAEIRFRLFTDSGTWEELRLSDKAAVNGTKYKQQQILGLDCLFDGGVVKQQLVKVMIDEDNEISKIYTANGLDKSVDGDALSGSLNINKNTTYKSGVLTDYSYSLNGTMIFVLPKVGGKYDEDLFEVAESARLSNDRTYLFKDFYDVSDTMQVKIALMEKQLSTYDYWNNYAVYVKSVDEVFRNGETERAIACVNKGNDVTYYTKDDDYLSDVNNGDILVIHLSRDNEIDTAVKKIYDAKTKTVTQSIRVNECETHSAWYGTVTAKDENNLLITQEDGTKRCVPIAAVRYTTFYKEGETSADKRFRAGKIQEVPKDARAIFYIRSGDSMDLTVFE